MTTGGRSLKEFKKSNVSGPQNPWIFVKSSKSRQTSPNEGTTSGPEFNLSHRSTPFRFNSSQSCSTLSSFSSPSATIQELSYGGSACMPSCFSSCSKNFTINPIVEKWVNHFSHHSFTQTSNVFSFSHSEFVKAFRCLLFTENRSFFVEQICEKERRKWSRQWRYQ